MITAIVRLETSDLWLEREGANPEREVLWFVPYPEPRFKPSTPLQNWSGVLELLSHIRSIF